MKVANLRAGKFDIFIASEDRHDGFAYYYGGTRCVSHATSDESVVDELLRLQRDESGLKNALINVALAQGALADCDPDSFPPEFLESRVGGARCILRPVDEGAARAMAQPAGEEFEEFVRPVFAEVGNYLNHQEGRIKLTPDFGRFAGLADLLYHHTPHVLGIRCVDGGCGGKASYSTTGVVAAFETLGCPWRKQPITLIGAAGAMGTSFLKYLEVESFDDVAVCDLVYDRAEQPVAVPTGVEHLESRNGCFTPACLARGGVLVATTIGRELENSNWTTLPEETQLLLAHNLAVPAGPRGVRLMRSLHRRNVKAYPGQILTLGGALTSRLEWFWRKHYPGKCFNKRLAHEVVHAVVSFIVRRIEAECQGEDTTPLEAMYRLAAEDRTTR